MSEQMFRFKQFSVAHDRCAMKVGTDGVLLGAWARVEGRRRLLDIGTGTGLVALMVAQRNAEAHVVAVEVDPDAAAQARENVANSPFAERIEVVESDIRLYAPDAPFDAILCNPPFFSEETLPPDASRALARHSSLLSFDELLAVVCRLLSADGEFHVILPLSECNRFIDSAFCRGLNLTRKCLVRTVGHKPPKRALLTFATPGHLATDTEELVLQRPDGSRTTPYSLLTKDYYL
ncbi:MAG: methyltransferase [Bacteroidaceae bacterium]|nr:methyltransferase [Bacteroidaceae bacterium]